MARLLFYPPILLAASLSLLADSPQQRLQNSSQVLADVLSAPDKGIPRELLAKSQCLVVVPGLKNAAFVVGAKYGRGFLLCRQENRPGWGAPAAVRIEGGSIGFQAGAAETDLVLLVINRSGVNRLLKSRFTLGGSAEAAAGPVGRDSTAQTDAMMTAEMLSYSRSRGIFAGVSLQGATLRQDLDQNQELYHRRMTNRQIVTTNPPPPASASELISVLNKYSSRN